MGEQSASVIGGCNEDVLPEFCNAAIPMLSAFQSVEFSFDEEQGEFRWVVASEGEATANLRIYDLPDFGGELSEEGVMLIFNASIGKVDFARAVHRAMSEVL